MKTEQSIIQVRDLTAAYEDRVILDRLSFEVREGEVFVILGGSGCGKSTLLKHLIGLYTPASGSVLLNGRDLVSADESTRQQLLMGIGVLYQSGALFGSMNLLENVMLPLEEYTRLPADAREAIARIKLKLVDLAGFEEHMPAEISGGMKKRAAMARAMALDPRMIFLDEPSAGLDPITSAELDRLILRLARDLHITFIIVSHELASIFSIADRVIMLDKRTKGIVAEGRPDELRDRSDNPWVRQFFNRTVESGSDV